MTKRPHHGDKPTIEACGPVQIKTGEEFYIDTTRATNNIVGMQCVIEALFLLNSCVERRTLQADADLLFTVDSRCVKLLIEEKFSARENSAGHAAGPHVESDKTKITTPADEGTRSELQHRWWRRCPLRGRDEEGVIKKIVNIQRETTVCQDALKTRWNGPTVFPRTDAVSHKLVPFRHWGHSQPPSPNQPSHVEHRSVEKPGPEQHDPMWVEVRRLGVERRCEKDPVKRKRLSIALCRARQLMRRKQTDLNFKKAVEAGAPSRLQGPPPSTRAPILEKLGADGTTERWNTLTAAQALSTSTSRSCSQIRRQKEIPGMDDGHTRSCNLCRPLTAKG